MDVDAIRSRPPLAVLVLVTAALIVVAAILAQAAAGIFYSIVRLAIIVAAFGLFAVIGLFLLRRGGTGRG